MNERIVLTAIWLASFVFSIVLIESYVDILNASGKYPLLPDDRLAAMRPLLILYGGYLAGILAFWFLKPFADLTTDLARRARFGVALACSLIFNGFILFMVAHEYLRKGGNILDDVQQAVQVAKWASFLVGPVMSYYFGSKLSTGSS